MKLLPCVLLVIACTSAGADDAISADRPDFTNSPDVVAAGRWQIEAGGAWQRANGTRLRSTPLLMRAGLGGQRELRVETDGWLRQREPAARGRGDLALGLKQQLAQPQDGAPGLGWLLEVDTPSGSGDFKGRGWRPGLSLLAQWELPKGWSLGTMAGLAVDRDDDGRRYTAGRLSASLGLPVGERWEAFTEIAAQQLAARRHGGHVITFAAGLAWPLGEDARLDTACFRGLNRTAPDWSWTAGLSLRF
jgi:hypothetical protein